MKKLLKNQTFFLDLQGSPYEEAMLNRDLIFFGAKPAVFSKDVSFVVSNQVSDVQNSASSKLTKITTKSQYRHPLTPRTNTLLSSSQSNQECSMIYPDSPAYSNSPATDQNYHPVVMSRGMAMVQKANAKKQGTTNIVESCRRFNVKIYSVEKAILWLKKMKSRFYKEYAEEQYKQKKVIDFGSGLQKMISPFLKIEDKQRIFKTVYREFPSWTKVIDPTLSRNVSQLYNVLKKSGNYEDALKSILDVNINASNFMPHASEMSPAFSPSVSKSFAKFSETPKASNSAVLSVLSVKRKWQENSPVPSKKQKSSQKSRKLKKNYCEICSKNYASLDMHLQSEKHMKFMANPINFLEVQNLISTLPKKGELLLSKQSSYEENDAGFISQDDSAPSLNYFSNLLLDDLEEPCPNGNRAEVNIHPNHSLMLLDLPKLQMESIECETEPYSFLDQTYVSPSCSSPDSNGLSYLEDYSDEFNRKDQKINTFKQTLVNNTIDSNYTTADICPLNIPDLGEASHVNEEVSGNSCCQEIAIERKNVSSLEFKLENFRNERSDNFPLTNDVISSSALKSGIDNKASISLSELELLALKEHLFERSEEVGVQYCDNSLAMPQLESVVGSSLPLLTVDMAMPQLIPIISKVNQLIQYDELNSENAVPSDLCCENNIEMNKVYIKTFSSDLLDKVVGVSKSYRNPSIENINNSLTNIINNDNRDHNWPSCSFIYEADYFSKSIGIHLELLYINGMRYQECLLSCNTFFEVMKQMGKLPIIAAPRLQNCLISVESRINVQPATKKLPNCLDDVKEWNLLLVTIESIRIQSGFIGMLLESCNGEAFIGLNKIKNTDTCLLPKPGCPFLATILFPSNQSKWNFNDSSDFNVNNKSLPTDVEIIDSIDNCSCPCLMEIDDDSNQPLNLSMGIKNLSNSATPFLKEPFAITDNNPCSVLLKEELNKVSITQKSNLHFPAETYEKGSCLSSRYVVVDEADFDSEPEHDWEPLQCEVDNLCKTLCHDNNDNSSYNMCY